MSAFLSIFKPKRKRDTHELRQVAEELEAAKTRYERIFRGEHGYGFLDWDVEKASVKWSGGFWSYLGYSESDMEYIADPIASLEYVHEDDREYLLAAFDSTMKGNDESEIIYRIRKKKGGYIWTEVRIEIERDSKNHVTYISGVAFDITHLKQTEEALVESENRHARIIQSSNDGVWEWSAKRGEFHFSDRCWQHLGYAEEDDAVTHGQDRVKVWRNLIDPDYVDIFDQALSKHIKLNLPYDVEYRMKGKDGAWRWIRSRGQMSFGENGEPQRMSGTNMNITELKRIEENVLRAKEEAENANKAKSDFLSSMSHELRTPLNAILAYSQLIEMDENLGEEQRINNREIKKAGLHLKQLVGDVLDLAKIEAGSLRLSMEETNLFRLVQECLLLIKAEVQKNNIKVVVDTNQNSKTRVMSSPMHLRQVVLNLLSNAVKYNNYGGSIHIVLSKTLEDRLRLVVKDTGKGVPEELQKELFQPFNRLGAEGGEVEGSGVGLVITQKLVEQMGGAIGFESEEDMGSSFWIELPLCDKHTIARHVSLDTPVGTVVDRYSSPTFHSTKKILYVEDNLSNQRVMEQIVARFPQLEIILEKEAVRGVYSARAKEPDMVLLDINLPVMDGYEILDVLKKDKRTASIPVVALSANAMSHDIEKGLELGFSEYLTKPVDVDKLITTFNRFLSD